MILILLLSFPKRYKHQRVTYNKNACYINYSRSLFFNQNIFVYGCDFFSFKAHSSFFGIL